MNEGVQTNSLRFNLFRVILNYSLLNYTSLLVLNFRITNFVIDLLSFVLYGNLIWWYGKIVDRKKMFYFESGGWCVVHDF